MSKMEEPSNLFDLPAIDQLRWYIINAYCNYENLKNENQELKERLESLSFEAQRNRELAARLSKEKQKLKKQVSLKI